MAEVTVVKKANPYECLRRKYPLTEYALMEEVSNEPGHSRSRSADYIIMNLWPSRGNSIIGIEQKASRSDWLSELKKPVKAEAIFKYCDYFYLYTTDENIAKIEEIPDAWGWMCIKGGKIFTKKGAPKQTPVPLTKGFVACLLKRACGTTELIHPDSIQDRVSIEAEKRAEQISRDAASVKNDYIELQHQVKLFEEASGVRLASKWSYMDNKKIGEAVKLIMSGGEEKYKKDLERIHDSAKRVYDSITETLAKISE